MAKSYSILCIYPIFCIPLLVNGYLGWCCGLAIVNSAAIQMDVEVYLFYANLYSFGYMPSGGIAGWPGSFISCKKYHTAFHRRCSTLYYHQQCFRVPLPWCSDQHLMFIFLKISNLTEVWWNLRVLLIYISFMDKYSHSCIYWSFVLLPLRTFCSINLTIC
jgi:hypothetical protein